MPRPRVTSHQFIVALCLKEEKGTLNVVSFQVGSVFPTADGTLFQGYSRHQIKLTLHSIFIPRSFNGMSGKVWETDTAFYNAFINITPTPLVWAMVGQGGDLTN